MGGGHWTQFTGCKKMEKYDEKDEDFINNQPIMKNNWKEHIDIMEEKMESTWFLVLYYNHQGRKLVLVDVQKMLDRDQNK